MLPQIIQNRLVVALVVGVILAALLLLALGSYCSDDYPYLSGVLANLATELLGSAVTVGIIDHLLERRRQHEHTASIRPQAQRLVETLRDLRLSHDTCLPDTGEHDLHKLDQYAALVREAIKSADSLCLLVIDLKPDVAAMISGVVATARLHGRQLENVIRIAQQEGYGMADKMRKLREDGADLLEEVNALTIQLTKDYTLTENVSE